MRWPDLVKKVSGWLLVGKNDSDADAAYR